MKKIYISLAIFVFIATLSAVSNAYIKNTTEHLCVQLMSVKSASSDGDFTKAKTVYKDLKIYFQAQEKWLSLLIKHDNLSSFAINLNGINAYLQEDNLSDLNFEIEKAVEHASRLDDVFSAIF